MKSKFWVSVCVLAFGFWAVYLSLCENIHAQPREHVVQKGDTLWDICEKYYGDADLWPKLWEMNPFITNPHLLKPGDVITLLEDVGFQKRGGFEKQSPLSGKEKEKPSGKTEEIDVSSFTDVGSIGYLSVHDVDPWGYIFSSERERVTLSEEDVVYVNMKNGRQVRMGDEFTVCRISPLLRHPLTGKGVGHLISFLGRIVIDGQIKENLYKARISEGYKGIQLGDPILPHEPVSSCVEPVSPDQAVTTSIVAVKDQRGIIGQFTVLYVDKGFREGIRRGNLFEIVKKNVVENDQSITSLPDISLGHLLVLQARPDSATGVVIRATQDVPNEALVKSLPWEKAPRVLSLLPKCPPE